MTGIGFLVAFSICGNTVKLGDNMKFTFCIIIAILLGIMVSWCIDGYTKQKHKRKS
jgi:hypothetical protein